MDGECVGSLRLRPQVPPTGQRRARHADWLLHSVPRCECEGVNHCVWPGDELATHPGTRPTFNLKTSGMDSNNSRTLGRSRSSATGHGWMNERQHLAHVQINLPFIRQKAQSDVRRTDCQTNSSLQPAASPRRRHTSHVLCASLLIRARRSHPEGTACRGGARP